MDEAGQLFAALGRSVADGRVALELDQKRLGHIDSPVSIEAEGNRWVYAGLVVSALVWWQFGMVPGLAVAGAALIAYLTIGRWQVNRSTAGRVREKALADIGTWRKLWRHGGVTLVAGDRSCAAPEGNWMQLVREISPAPTPAAPDRGTPAPGG